MMICCSYRRHQLSDFFGDIFRPETNRLNLPRWAESVFNEKRSRKRSVHERASRDRRRSREGELGGGRGGAARGSGGAVCFEFTFCRERWRQAAGRDASCSLIGGEGKIGKVIGEQREQRAPQEGGVREVRGFAVAGAILAPSGVTAPVVAALHAGLAALDEGAPLRRGVRDGLALDSRH
ncbi:MAG: hypothetical protein RL077_851 [Verrucomicrobiota bacterium]|jgi:hypothetical protein